MSSPYENLLVKSQSINDLAFHGTSESSAEIILQEGFTISEGENQFLGTGVYFFDNQRSVAIWWAKDHRGYKPPAVLRCTVRLGCCFNFQEPSHTDALQILIEALEEEEPEVSDATAINALALLTPVDSVVCNVRRKNTKPYRPKSRFMQGHKAIICIRDPANVIGCKLDYTED